jgi:hypothetical protein
MRIRLPLSTLVLAALVAADTPAVVAQADAYGEKGDRIEGAPYRVRVPREWNGTFLVYAPGYQDRAEGGEPPT